MKNSCLRCLGPLAVLLMTTGMAHAADHGFYLGAAYSDISPDFPSTYNPLTASMGDGTVGDEGYEIFAGYRALDWLAIEASYNDFGDSHGTTVIVCVTTPCPTDFSASTEAGSLSALGMYSIGKFDLFARAGFTSWRAKADFHESGGDQMFSQDDSDTDFSYGAGAQFNYSHLIARLEYEHFRFGGGRFGDSEADVWSFGLAWSFY